MDYVSPKADSLADDRDLFTEDEVAAAFTFILSEEEASAYAREAYSLTGRGAFFLVNTFSLLSLLSADAATRVRQRLNESEAQEGARMRTFLHSVTLRREPYRRYE